MENKNFITIGSLISLIQDDENLEIHTLSGKVIFNNISDPKFDSYMLSEHIPSDLSNKYACGISSGDMGQLILFIN